LYRQNPYWSQPYADQYYSGIPVNPQVVRVVPIVSNRFVTIPITSTFRTYLVISGILYLLYAALTIGLEVGIIINTVYSVYLRGIWGVTLFIIAGIVMLVTACRQSYLPFSLIRLICISFISLTFGLIVSIINVTNLTPCNYSYRYYCDTSLIYGLTISSLVVYVIAFIHNIISLIVIRNNHTKAMLLNRQNIPTY